MPLFQCYVKKHVIWNALGRLTKLQQNTHCGNPASLYSEYESPNSTFLFRVCLWFIDGIIISWTEFDALCCKPVPNGKICESHDFCKPTILLDFCIMVPPLAQKWGIGRLFIGYGRWVWPHCRETCLAIAFDGNLNQYQNQWTKPIFHNFANTSKSWSFHLWEISIQIASSEHSFKTVLCIYRMWLFRRKSEVMVNGRPWPQCALVEVIPIILHRPRSLPNIVIVELFPVTYTTHM